MNYFKKLDFSDILKVDFLKVMLSRSYGYK